MHWTGHTGCVILAPHLTALKKKDLGLPHMRDATPRQKRDGMCWQREDELYNDGSAFKVTCRDATRRDRHASSRTTISVIARRKSRPRSASPPTSTACAEEEHAGGAMAFPSYVLGEDFCAGRTVELKPAKLRRGAAAARRPRGDRSPKAMPSDRQHPGRSFTSRRTPSSTCAKAWSAGQRDGARQQITLRPDEVYVLPSGYRVRLEKQPAAPRWRLVGTRAEGTLCHKPCTVSGGGKIEISKSIADVLLQRPRLRQGIPSRPGRGRGDPREGLRRSTDAPAPEARSAGRSSARSARSAR